MPPPPTAESLWPTRRLRGLGVVRARRAVMTALSRAGYALKEGPRVERPQRLAPAIEAVIANARVERLIGRPTPARPGDDPWPDDEAPSWIALDTEAPTPLLRLGFRGALIRTQFHRELNDRGRVIKIEATESERLYAFEALKEAADAARQALRAAGFTLSAYAHVEQLHGGQSGVAAIGLRSLSPARTRGPTMAR